MDKVYSCNSAYRLRYWNFSKFLKVLFNTFRLQQCLPFTVLKLKKKDFLLKKEMMLQQCLPFTVLKLYISS